MTAEPERPTIWPQALRNLDEHHQLVIFKAMRKVAREPATTATTAGGATSR
ncbi:hypothetical protein [Streptomyces sp. NPDC059479]|uniref:hypothetical protein n=1 Tax=Streptomyces sp. NPDC059479 TaxID=3346848 RepID=UPI0036915DA1